MTLDIGLHVVGARTVGVRTLRHDQIFLPMVRRTGGHFACACVQPLYKEGVIAVIKMAREIQIVLFMFILVSFLIVSFTIQGNRAAEKCAVCGKTIVGEDGRPASGYKKDFLSCFGIDANTDGKVCGQCRKAVTDHRKSDQKFFV